MFIAGSCGMNELIKLHFDLSGDILLYFHQFLKTAMAENLLRTSPREDPKGQTVVQLLHGKVHIKENNKVFYFVAVVLLQK
ncbi:unnamed protein product [Cylicocyclus nassatus]|uniref:Uncharacterized protein n=1 Tax=Cylicocyclus nassatus TaxID=53992 RepID=A0AA36GRT8_CYLNA|nr:unnamed protein product [Cylicocyclus nassatus]